MRRAGLVFDFDGTIALSEPVHIAAWGDVATSLGKTLPRGFAEHGCGLPDELLARELEPVLGRGAAELLAWKSRRYQERAHKESVLVPGIVELLQHYKGLRPIGLATSASADDIAPTLEMHGLRPYFDVILTVEMVSQPKPHPEIYLAVAERLGLNPAKTVVFEDSPAGAKAARAAGMRLVGLTTSFGLEVIGPAELGISDYCDLVNLTKLIG